VACFHSLALAVSGMLSVITLVGSYFALMLTGICLIFFQIMNEITQQKINIYEFPNCADEEENKMMRKLKVCMLTVLNGRFISQLQFGIQH